MPIDNSDKRSSVKCDNCNRRMQFLGQASFKTGDKPHSTGISLPVMVVVLIIVLAIAFFSEF